MQLAEEEANLLAKSATEAQQEILRINQENAKVPDGDVQTNTLR